MTTTIELPDSVYDQVKAHAALQGKTVDAFLVDAIREKLAEEEDGETWAYVRIRQRRQGSRSGSAANHRRGILQDRSGRLEMILDTNAVSAVLDGDTDIKTLRQSRSLLPPAIVIGEYRFGLLSSKKRRRLESHFRQLVSKCMYSRLIRTGRYAQIRFELKQKGRPLPDNDIWIAALARQHNSVVGSVSTRISTRDG